MPSTSQEGIIKWYVLNYFGETYRDLPQKAVDRYNLSNGTKLELYAPTYVVREERNGELKFRTVNLTYHYVFVRGDFENIKKLCGLRNGFSFLIDRMNEDRHATIDDRKMASFQNIASAYKNCLPYFSLDDIDLEDGDLVEVVKGDFPGLIGTYIPNAKSKSGNIVLRVFNNVGTVAFNVKVTDVRVLEFSRNSTRANDQIDAFIPHLLKALRHYHANEALPPALAAKLSVFCGRMEVVKMNNRKLDAKLQILLYAANQIIGNTAEAQRALAHYERVADSVTNEWTIALIKLLQAVINQDGTKIVQGLKTLPIDGYLTKSKQLIIEEYKYYLST